MRDVANAGAVEAMFANIAERGSEVAVLVKNADIMDLAPIAKMDAETFDRMVAINLKGTFNAPQGGCPVNGRRR